MTKGTLGADLAHLHSEFSRPASNLHVAAVTRRQRRKGIVHPVERAEQLIEIVLGRIVNEHPRLRLIASIHVISLARQLRDRLESVFDDGFLTSRRLGTPSIKKFTRSLNVT